MSLRNRRALGLFAVSAIAGAGHVLISLLVKRGKTRDEDIAARRRLREHRSKRAERLAEATGHIGKWYTHVPIALVGAALLARNRRFAASAAIAGASLGAAAASPCLDRIHAHRTPPPTKRKIEPDAQSFPSGHALETTAATFTAAWVLAREGVAPGVAAAPVAVLASLVSGVGRLVLDRHWVTDSVAGYCAGIALGAACAGAYEIAR